MLLAGRLAPAQAQVPGFVWASACASPTAASQSQVRKTVRDQAGNVYITGIFRGSLTLGRTTLTAVGNYDVFVAKLDSAGTYQWAAAAGGYGWDISNGLALDNQGNVHLTGYCEGSTARFGGALLFTPTDLFEGMGYNLFVATLTADGKWQRAVRAGGADVNNFLIGTSLAADAQGNTYVTGSFRGRDASFGRIRLANEGVYNVFVACLDAGGEWRWAIAGGGNGNGYDTGSGIALDAAGALYVAGTFGSQQLRLGGLALANAGRGEDAFVLKLSAASGAGQWAMRVSSPGADSGNALAIGPAGDVYLTGSLGGAARIGELELPKAGADADLFVARLDGRTGAARWAVRGGGAQSDFGSGIALDADGTSYVSGSFGGEAANFGPVQLRSAGKLDVVVASLDAAGNWRWAVRAGGPADDYGSSVAADGRRGAYVAGTFESASAGFGGLALASGSPLEGVFNCGYVAQVADLTQRLPAAELMLWPNPARRNEPVWAANLPAGQPVRVYDAVGRLVVADARPAYAFQGLALPPGLRAGMYVVRCGSQARQLLLE